MEKKFWAGLAVGLLMIIGVTEVHAEPIKETKPPTGNPTVKEATPQDNQVKQAAALTDYSIKEIIPSTNEAKSSLLISTGGFGIGDAEIEGRRRNIKASMTITQLKEGVISIDTESKDDKLYDETGDIRPVTVVPSGDGTIYRFKGTVKNFYKDYTFTSSGKDPLVFSLSKTTGLTFISGEGSVRLPDGNVITLAQTGSNVIGAQANPKEVEAQSAEKELTNDEKVKLLTGGQEPGTVKARVLTGKEAGDMATRMINDFNKGK